MSVSAAISFKQGVSTSAPGVSLIGVDGSSVTASNGNNTNVVNWLYEWIDVPPTSVIPHGVVQNGALPTYSFTPDVTGGFLLHLVTTDAFGNFAEDFRVFQVPEASGRIIPPFKGSDVSLNFIISAVMNTRGWAPFMEAYLRELDTDDIILSTIGETWVSKNHAASPYTLAKGESVFVDVSGGVVTIKMPLTASRVGEKHTVTDDVGDASANNITVDGNGHNVEDPNTPGTFSATVLISVKSASVDWRWDGSKWKIV